MKREKIIIIGGGFAGLHLVRKLNKSIYDVLLIDKENHHQFQPLFYQVASARLEPASISFPFRKIFQRSPNVQIRMAEVLRIFPDQNKITTSIGDFVYDKLIIATGCKTNFFGNKNIEEHALSMKNTSQAIAIRNKTLIDFEALISAKEDEREALNNIVIVGAGPTGVELAGAFAEMKKQVLPRDYPKIDFSKIKVYLIDGNQFPLNNMSAGAQAASSKYLTQLGVCLKMGTIVNNYDGTQLNLSTGEIIHAKSVIWAAGVQGNIIEGIALDTILRNRYKVDRGNKIFGFENIYAVGDVAYMVTPKYPNAHPQVANVAINQAKNLAWNLLHSNRKQKEYEYLDWGSMATIGKNKAVVDLPFIKFKGLFAWLFWMFLHLMLILSVRNKLIVFINWTWAYFTQDTSLRLIIRHEKKD